MHKDYLDGGQPLHIMLAYAPLGLVRATARQLRYDGMTVDTGMVTLDEQAEVELSFTHRHHDELITHRLRAQVVASSRGTAVLAFTDYARTTREILHQLIDGATTARRYARGLSRLPIPAWLIPQLPPGGRLA
ncbi:hypothetical protein [Sulfurivermis fontis]|uniref:hypothetical protein n=1 Tax=Sulfurivermis fontis TaxID=1972068 RepID=UPI000FD8F0C8|nr:hypothetical protein [Sulfurivermis fontis]